MWTRWWLLRHCGSRAAGLGRCCWANCWPASSRCGDGGCDTTNTLYALALLCCVSAWCERITAHHLLLPSWADALQDVSQLSQPELVLLLRCMAEMRLNPEDTQVGCVGRVTSRLAGRKNAPASARHLHMVHMVSHSRGDVVAQDVNAASRGRDAALRGVLEKPLLAAVLNGTNILNPFPAGHSRLHPCRRPFTLRLHSGPSHRPAAAPAVAQLPNSCLCPDRRQPVLPGPRPS